MSCSNNQKNPIPKLQPKIITKGKIYQKGYSTWYGPGFHNRLTASGERYNMYAYTAAHRTLPLQTIIKVKNVKNGLWTVVRINDRGPVKKTLILDLSKIAAIDLQITQHGSALVYIQILSKSSNPMQKIFQVYAKLADELN